MKTYRTVTSWKVGYLGGIEVLLECGHTEWIKRRMLRGIDRTKRKVFCNKCTRDSERKQPITMP